MRHGEVVEMEIPSAPEYVSVVRYAVEGIARRMSFDATQISDLKLAVGEACTNAVRHGCAKNGGQNIAVRCIVMPNGLLVEVRNYISGCACPTVPSKPDIRREGGFGLFMMEKLMDEVDIQWEDEVAVVKMLKKFTLGQS